MQEIHPELLKTIHGNRLIGALCIIGAFIALGTFAWYRFQGGFFFITLTVVLCVAAYALLVRCENWYARASWVLANTEPTPMSLVLRTEQNRERKEVVITLIPVDGEPLADLGMLWPAWDTEAFPTDSSANVYRDPESDGPVVVRTERGLLWPYPRLLTGAKSSKTPAA